MLIYRDRHKLIIKMIGKFASVILNVRYNVTNYIHVHKISIKERRSKFRYSLLLLDKIHKNSFELDKKNLF